MCLCAMCVYAYLYTHVSVHVLVYVYACMYMCAHACTCAYVYDWEYVCTIRGQLVGPGSFLPCGSRVTLGCEDLYLQSHLSGF